MGTLVVEMSPPQHHLQPSRFREQNCVRRSNLGGCNFKRRPKSLIINANIKGTSGDNRTFRVGGYSFGKPDYKSAYT